MGFYGESLLINLVRTEHNILFLKTVSFQMVE